NKDINSVYEMYPGAVHMKIDQLLSNTVYYFEKHHKDLPAHYKDNIEKFGIYINKEDPIAIKEIKENELFTNLENENVKGEVAKLEKKIQTPKEELIIFKKKLIAKV